MKTTKVSKKSQLLFIVGVLLLIGAYIFPLWRIDLGAPQYPDGLTMYIHINDIEGNEPNTLENINILNHYIGMKKIEPDSIPELKYMPVIMGILIALGLGVAFTRNLKLYIAWVIILIIAMTAGLVDFYLWEYDYGHNLNPEAPLKLLEAYQPPFIGRKVILNFVAESWPEIGGILVGIGALLTIIAIFLEIKKGGASSSSKYSFASLILLMSFFLASCSNGPEPIHYGEDQCVFCKMKIIDRHYGAEAITDKGKVFKFDAIECFLNYRKENPDKKFQAVYVVPYDKPGTLIKAETAYYLITPELPSPMRGDINAFSSKKVAEEFYQKHKGELLSWQQLLQK